MDVYAPASLRYKQTVSNFFFSDFLSAVQKQERVPCACGRSHKVQTREILVSATSREESARHVADVFGSKARLWVLSDQNTEAAAGQSWKKDARAGALVSRILPAVPRPHPTMALADSLAVEAREAKPDLLVAVGSGVVSDLVKRVSLQMKVPNWCIATAPSVDAYTSATSAILVDGFHSAVPAEVSQLVACDLRVMERAPRELFLAGLGDLLAKIPRAARLESCADRHLRVVLPLRGEHRAGIGPRRPGRRADDGR